jgi:hypothetical protein
MAMSIILPIFLAGNLITSNGTDSTSVLWPELPPLSSSVNTDVLIEGNFEIFRAGLSSPGFAIKHPATSEAFQAGGYVSWTYGNYVETENIGTRFRLENFRLSLGLELDQFGTDDELTIASAMTLTTLEYEYKHKFSEYADMPMSVGVVAGTYNGTGVYGASANTRLNLPISTSLGLILGRLLPGDARVAITQIENMLVKDGVLSGQLPVEITNQIMAMWYGHKNELGREQRSLLIAQILSNAGVLTGPINAATAYRIETLVREGTGSGLLQRYSGNETRIMIRAGTSFSGADMNSMFETNIADPTLALEARNRSVYNLSETSELWFEPALGLAPRKEDRSGNNLPGHRRVGLLTSNATGNAAANANGMLVLDVPINYNQLFYDAYYNKSGLASIHLGTSVGFDPDATNTLGFVVTGGAAYTMFTSGADAWKLGVNAGLGYLNGAFQPSVEVVATFLTGTGDDFYTAPDAIGDSADFDTTRVEKTDEGIEL